MRSLVSLLAFVSTTSWALPQKEPFTPKPGYFPQTGDGAIPGGIFCIPISDLPKYAPNGAGGGTESPKGAGQATSGSGPYPAKYFTDSSLPNHVIFAPQKAPADLVMPFIGWANGACAMSPSQFTNFLLEVASHGYVIAADGSYSGNSAQSRVQDLRDSLDWAFKGGAAKYGNVDLNKTSTAGQSCGGLSALSTAYHDDRVKRILMFDIAIFEDSKRYLLSEIKVPIAYFIGGKTDMGYEPSAKDYALLNKGLPSLRVNLDTGHSGTYTATNGGKFGKAAVAFLEWQWRGNTTAKAMIMDKNTPGSLVSDNWTVEYKNWDGYPGVV